MSGLPEIFYGHDNVAVIERHVRRGREFKRHTACPDLFDCEMDCAHSDVELQRQADLPETRVHLFDPLLDAFRIERPHVPGQDHVNQVANGFALLFRARMQLDHPRIEAGAVPAPGPGVRVGMPPAYGNYNVVFGISTRRVSPPVTALRRVYS